MSDEYNPNSIDSRISQIIEQMEESKRAKAVMHEENQRMLNLIWKEAKITNGRVTRLENWKWWVTGLCAGVAVLAAMAWELIKHVMK